MGSKHTNTVLLADSPGYDAFHRLRVSNPVTLFDTQQQYNLQPLLWETSASSTTAKATHLPDESSAKLSVATGTNVTRQTFQYFRYQPGKALAHGEPVLTPSGWVAIEDIKIGDRVFDGLGVITEVLGVYSQGEREIVRITFDDGTHVDCDLDHLWKTIVRRDKKAGQSRILSTRDMLDEYGEYPTGFQRWRIPASPVLQYQHQEVPIDPYTLGAILGDGRISPNGFAEFTTADTEILEYLECEEVTKRKTRYAYGLRGLGKDITGLGLAGLGSHAKYIPDLYKYNDSDTRLAVLRGLMDTDGYVDRRNGGSDYSSVSLMLAEDVAFLVRSLGGQAKIKWRETGYYSEDGEHHVFPSYRVTVIMPICPFRLERKAGLWKPRTRISFDRYIHSIVPIGRTQATCIRVASDDHTFLTRNNVVTHNSGLVMMTGVLGAQTAGVTKRLGYYDDENGFFFELSPTAINIVLRSNVTGSVVNTRIAQAKWSNDTYPEFDTTKSQIFFFDFQWLGVGRVRAGIVEHGVPRVLHEFHNANHSATAYITTANLPVRYFCGSTVGGSTSADMRQICTSVISEGGFDDEIGIPQSSETALGGVTVNSSVETHVLSIRPALTFNGIKTRGRITLETVDLIGRTNDARWRLIYNGTMSTAGWSNNSTANSMVEVAPGSTVTITGGVPILSGWVVAGSGQRAQQARAQPITSKLPLSLDKAGTAQRGVSLVAQARTATAVIHASLNWREVY